MASAILTSICLRCLAAAPGHIILTQWRCSALDPVRDWNGKYSKMHRKGNKMGSRECKLQWEASRHYVRTDPGPPIERKYNDWDQLPSKRRLILLF